MSRLPKIRIALEADDRMAITFGWNMVDQIYQPVLQATDSQMVNQMDNQRRLPDHLPDVHAILSAANDPLHS